MIIKSFTAPTVAGALKIIKEELGNSAVILKTRLCPHTEAAQAGDRVEVTACIDESALSPRAVKKETKPRPEIKSDRNKSVEQEASLSHLSATSDPVDFAVMLEKKLDCILNSQRTEDSLGEIDRRVRPVYLSLIDADIPVEIAREMAKEVATGLTSETAELVAYKILLQELKKYTVDEVPIEPGMRVVIVGPSGAGKTSALAKMAALLSSGLNKKVTLSSLDNIKVSAYEEISGYADMLGVPLDFTGRSEKKHKKDSILLIDTPSLNGREEQHMELVKKIREISPDIIFLCFSVCTRSRDLIDSINLFESLAPSYLIAGHLDETPRWGGILTMMRYLDTPLAYLADSPGGMGLLKKAEPALIARRILKVEEAGYEE
jgi:flagellar biosynthesis protein FlhF